MSHGIMPLVTCGRAIANICKIAKTAKHDNAMRILMKNLQEIQTLASVQ
jgi:hypothetical protein